MAVVREVCTPVRCARHVMMQAGGSDSSLYSFNKHQLMDGGPDYVEQSSKEHRKLKM